MQRYIGSSRPAGEKRLSDLLNARLADSIDLTLMTKQAHWNVKGPQFLSHHQMFDRLRADLDGHVDAVAERIVQLGGTALGTTQAVARMSQLGSYPTDIYSGTAHLVALHERFVDLAEAVRDATDHASLAEDRETEDMLIDFSRTLAKSIWFIEAHLQDDRAEWPLTEAA